MRITVDQAREYWGDKSQQDKSMIFPDDLPDDEAFQYWAIDGVCGVFHRAAWPGVWMAHYGVKETAWGKTVDAAKSVIGEFWAAESPEAIIGWTAETNRQALSFAKRLGFKENGRMMLKSGAVVMQELKL